MNRQQRELCTFERSWLAVGGKEGKRLCEGGEQVGIGWVPGMAESSFVKRKFEELVETYFENFSAQNFSPTDAVIFEEIINEPI